MYIIATEDLEYYIPWSGRNGGNTAVDVARKDSTGNVPRLFTNKLSAKLALGHWLSGPYDGICDEGGWYAVQATDPNRRIAWEGKLAPRKIRLTVA